MISFAEWSADPRSKIPGITETDICPHNLRTAARLKGLEIFMRPSGLGIFTPEANADRRKIQEVTQFLHQIYDTSLFFERSIAERSTLSSVGKIIKRSTQLALPVYAVLSDSVPEELKRVQALTNMLATVLIVPPDENEREAYMTRKRNDRTFPRFQFKSSMITPNVIGYDMSPRKYQFDRPARLAYSIVDQSRRGESLTVEFFPTQYANYGRGYDSLENVAPEDAMEDLSRRASPEVVSDVIARGRESFIPAHVNIVHGNVHDNGRSFVLRGDVTEQNNRSGLRMRLLGVDGVQRFIPFSTARDNSDRNISLRGLVEGFNFLKISA